MLDKVLCIEDDKTIQVLVASSLNEFDVSFAGSISEAKDQLSKNMFNAILIDIQLPDGDGLRFLTSLVNEDKFSKLPILVLSDHAEISNKVMAFTFGAEDFIAKPFDPIELNARLSAKVRRRKFETEKAKIEKYGDVHIDLDRQKVFFYSEGIAKDLLMTGMEIRLLCLLTRRLEQVYSRDQILDSLWQDTSVADRAVDSHIVHLRQKLVGTRLEIETVFSVGYRAILKK